MDNNKIIKSSQEAFKNFLSSFNLQEEATNVVMEELFKSLNKRTYNETLFIPIEKRQEPLPPIDDSARKTNSENPIE